MILTLIALPSSTTGEVWTACDTGARGVSQSVLARLSSVTHAFGDCFTVAADGELQLAVQNWLLHWKAVGDAVVSDKVIRQFGEVDPLAGLVSWLGRLNELQSESRLWIICTAGAVVVGCKFMLLCS